MTDIRTSRRNTLKKFLMTFIDKIPLSRNVKRNWLRAVHYALPVTLLFFATCGSIYFFYLATIIIISIIILFIFLRGCILSSLEKELFQDDNNVIDIILELLGLEKNTYNRMTATYFCFVIYIIFFIWVYNYRFT